MSAAEHVPVEIRLQKKSRCLVVTFPDDEQFTLPAEYLRVHSPSAEVRGHGPGQEVLQQGKEAVGIAAIEPIGNYAIRLIFDDGHDTGLYTWTFLYELGTGQDEKWAAYLERLKAAGIERRQP